MHIRAITDPITPKDLPNPATHPCVHEGDGENGVVIHFESAQTRGACRALRVAVHAALASDDSDDPIAEG